MTNRAKTITHEDYIKAIKEIVCNHASGEMQAQLNNIKLVYGAGHGLGARGITLYDRWSTKEKQHLVEICALGEENFTQLAGTTIHELAHVLAGHGHGHDLEWKKLCDTLGLRKAMAAGMQYLPANFAPWFREQWSTISKPNDGKPARSIDINGAMLTGAPIFKTTRGCTLGYGVRGGKSRGIGSGSRLRLYTCACKTKVRVASDSFDATCNVCKQKFSKVEKSGAV